MIPERTCIVATAASPRCWPSWTTSSTYASRKEVLDAGDYVVVPVRLTGRGRTSGVSFEEDEVHVYKIRDGKITELREYRHRHEALKAAGLEQ
jgi:ketosteroid isomerase-like protein